MLICSFTATPSSGIRDLKESWNERKASHAALDLVWFGLAILTSDSSGGKIGVIDIICALHYAAPWTIYQGAR